MSRLPQNIRRAPEGRPGYQVRYRDPDGKRRTRTFRTVADARAFLKVTEHQVQVGDWIAPEAGQVFLGDYFDQYRETVVALRPSTLDRDDRVWRLHVAPRFSDRRLADIDRTAIRAWVADLTAAGYAAETVQKCHQVLGKVLRSAVEDGLLRASPAERIPLPRIERPEMRFLTPEELHRLADLIDPAYRALVLLGGYGGLRIGELLGLRVRRIERLAARVTVAEIQTEVGGTIAYGPPKTRAGRRVVPVPRLVIDALAGHLDGRRPTDLVFPTPSGAATRASLFRRRVFDPAVTAAGLDDADLPRVTPHTLRHSAVAFWLAAGASPREVAARAGHGSVVTVLDRYGHVLPSAEKAVTDELERVARAAAATVSDGSVVRLRRL